jgi:hypothetical protein
MRSIETSTAGLIVQTGLIARNQHIEVVQAPHFEFFVECFDAKGNKKWEEDFRNLVTRVGMAYMLDMCFAAGAGAQTWFLGLISSASYSAVAKTDTAASHAGWLEYTNYSQGTRPALSWSAASTGSDNVDKVASAAAAYTINGGGGTVKGCFVITNSTKSGTTGTMYSAGLFGADRVVADTDTLNVTPTLRVAV